MAKFSETVEIWENNGQYFYDSYGAFISSKKSDDLSNLYQTNISNIHTVRSWEFSKSNPTPFRNSFAIEHQFILKYPLPIYKQAAGVLH